MGDELLRWPNWRPRTRVSIQVYQTWRGIGTLQGRACCQELYAVIPSGVYQNRSRQACMTPNWRNGIVGQITNHAATPVLVQRKWEKRRRSLSHGLGTKTV